MTTTTDRGAPGAPPDRTGPRAPFTGLAVLAPSDEAAGNPAARAQLAGYDLADLIREWRELHRACFDLLFGHNAAQHFNLVVDELHARGVMELPNLFGPIPVHHWRMRP